MLEEKMVICEHWRLSTWAWRVRGYFHLSYWQKVAAAHCSGRPTTYEYLVMDSTSQEEVKRLLTLKNAVCFMNKSIAWLLNDLPCFLLFQILVIYHIHTYLTPSPAPCTYSLSAQAFCTSWTGVTLQAVTESRHGNARLQQPQHPQERNKPEHCWAHRWSCPGQICSTMCCKRRVKNSVEASSLVVDTMWRTVGERAVESGRTEKPHEGDPQKYAVTAWHILVQKEGRGHPCWPHGPFSEGSGGSSFNRRGRPKLICSWIAFVEILDAFTNQC